MSVIVIRLKSILNSVSLFWFIKLHEDVLCCEEVVVYPPQKSDGISNHVSVHWSGHFKGLYNKKRISLLVMNMADNHLRNFYCHNQLKHGGSSFPYFDYNAKNRTSDLIQADANVKKARVDMKLTEIGSETKKRKEASNQALPDMSVCEE